MSRKEQTNFWTKERLLLKFLELEKNLGGMPRRDDWHEAKYCPSDMPIRKKFGSWNQFVIAAGREPRKPYLSALAHERSVLALKGKRSTRWKGGRMKTSTGYILVWKTEYPGAPGAGYQQEHRVVMAEHLGRDLIKGENVHHINGERSDNRIENLELWNTTQPSGQRVSDKIKYAKEILELYKDYDK